MDDAPYEDTPAAAMARVCSTCGGTGTVALPLIPAVEGALEGYERCVPCPECRSRSGRTSLAAGPGARLRRVDRVVLPGDGW